MSHPWKSPPMDHQLEGMRKAWNKSEYAFFWEMGTGKTFAVINLAMARFLKKQINSLIILCPSPIKLVWEEEISKWCNIEYEYVVLEAGKTSAEKLIYFTSSETFRLKIVIVGIEALSNGNGYTLIHNFARLNRCMVACDESSRIKNPKADRTERAIKIAAECYYRVIMTGTPITQGMHDLYSQFEFLNPKIIGLTSYFLFKNMYCVTGGFKGKKILGYQNENTLMDKISPYVNQVKKIDVLDLPDKVYEKVVVAPTPEQIRAIKQLVDSHEAEQGDKLLTTNTALERLTRFQQIIGGHFPFDDELILEDGKKPKKTYGVTPIDGPNPKLNELMNIIEDLPDKVKVIVWARFVPEIELIQYHINQMFPRMAVTFYGRNNEDERKANVKQFQEGDARFIVSNQAVGGMGQTWTAATFVIYYSNSFSYEDRKQSEDRAHRKGQTNKVTYIDIEAAHKYDKMILSAIGKKSDIADYVDGEISGRNQA